MKPHAPILSTSLVLALSATACVDADALDTEDFSEADLLDGDDDEPMDPESTDRPVPAPTDSLGETIDPSEIIGGFVLDSDRDVAVFNNLPAGGTTICTGTLLRNNVVLTARHCITQDSTIGGALQPAGSIVVQQDGPGATMGAAMGVLNVAAMGTLDVAMLRLTGSMSINGETMGQSTQILATPQSEVVGLNVLCQGYGRDTCEDGAGTLRGGLVHLDASNAGYLSYESIPGYDWLQWKGDSGSSCRLGAFMPARLNKVLGVQSTGICGSVANEVGPDLYRDWAVEQMNIWSGDYIDTFSWWQPYDVEEPAGMLQGPSNWVRAGGVLTENSNAYTNTTYHEGSRYIHAAQVAEDTFVRVTVTSPDNDAAGLVLRHRDDTHYYRLSFDEQRDYARIVRRSGNSWTVIDEDLNFDIDWSTSPEIAFYAYGTLFIALVDGQIVLAGWDNDIDGYTSGRAGIYTWGLTNATFDNFEVDRIGV